MVTMYIEDDLIPLLALQYLLFCESQRALIHIELAWAENRDATVVFCDWYISRSSRIHDQMVQAARSGKQNIAEGCMASGTSKKFELKLVGVARASLEELLLDFQDYLRQHKLLDAAAVVCKAVRKLMGN